MARWLVSCQQPQPAPDDYAYFPLITGQYIIYDVEERRYALNIPPAVRRYQLKEVTGQPYTDPSGQTAYRLRRYRRPTETDPWQADSIWTARLVRNEAIRGENGRDFVQLVFPLSEGLRWNGNRYNPLGEDAYELRNSGQPYRVQSKQFDETVTVAAQDDSTLLSQDKRIDVYARRVGLIYRERTQLVFCTASATCTGRGQIDYGIQHIYRIRSYGQE